MMLELQHEIEEKFAKREQQLNLSHVMDICTRIEEANTHLEEILSELSRFWSEV